MKLSEQRDLASAYWRGETTTCPDHPGSAMRGEFVRTTFADHLVFRCERGAETLTIPQRPKQVEFNDPQVAGLLLNLARGDSIRCYRCQANLVTETDAGPAREATRYDFICVRCLSWGTWEAEKATVNE